MDLQCESINTPPAPPENSQINNYKWIMPLLLSTSKLNPCKLLKYSQGTVVVSITGFCFDSLVSYGSALHIEIQNANS